MAIYPDFADYSTFINPDGTPDLDPSFTPIAGSRAVLEHVARRLISPPGSYDDPEWGIDLHVYMGANLLDQELAGINAAVRNEVLQVEGVDDATVSTALSPTGELRIEVIVTLADQEDYFLVFVLSADTIPRVYFP